MTEDLYAEEKEINKVFNATVDEIGFDSADLAFFEINEYIDDEDRLERAVMIAKKFGANLEVE